MLTAKNPTQNIALQNEQSLQLTPADLSNFLKACYSKGIEIEDFEDLFLDFSDAVTDQTRDDAASRDLKIKLFFLRKLNSLFKSMIHVVD